MFLRKNIVWIIIILTTLNIGLYLDLEKASRLNESEVIVLNVGQGDAILVKSQGLLGLIDTGPNNNISESLSKYLPMFITTLDFVILTHPDKDHVEGFLRLSETYQINKLFITNSQKENLLIKAIDSQINSKAIPIYYLYEDNDYNFGDLQINILWPSRNIHHETIDSNDLSIAIEITKDKCNIYTGGDLSSTYELESTKYLKSLPVDVLKVGHHGSKHSTSNEFINKTKPQIAAISYGEDNNYGHPSNDVTKILNNFSIKIFSTPKKSIRFTFLENNFLKIQQDTANEKIQCF